MTSHLEAQEILRRVGGLADDEIDLAESALALAALEEPDVELAPYLTHLADMAGEVAELVAPDEDCLDARIGALRQVVVHRHGYRGDITTYDDPQNASLVRVIDRRRGLPVSLGILFLDIAHRLGWTMVGLNFPGHFLVRLECEGERAIIDPFNEGQVRSVVDLRDLLKAAAGTDAELEPGHYAPVGSRDILLRLQNNLKLRFLTSDRIDRAVGIVEGMLLFAPQEANLWREAGLLHAHLGNLPPAVAALETYLSLGRDGPARRQAAILLQQIKARLH